MASRLNIIKSIKNLPLTEQKYVDLNTNKLIIRTILLGVGLWVYSTEINLRKLLIRIKKC